MVIQPHPLPRTEDPPIFLPPTIVRSRSTLTMNICRRGTCEWGTIFRALVGHDAFNAFVRACMSHSSLNRTLFYGWRCKEVVLVCWIEIIIPRGLSWLMFNAAWNPSFPEIVDGRAFQWRGIEIPTTAFVKSDQVGIPLMIPLLFLKMADGRAFQYGFL